MPIIEGVGDEVIQFFGIAFVGFLAACAWWSTNIRDLPQISTVLILERRSQTSQQNNTHSNRADVTQENINTQGETDVSVRSGENKNDSEARNSNNSSQHQESGPVNGNSDDNSSRNVSPRRADVLQDQSNTNHDSDNITIRLKYLNDDQKLVDGRLQELLGDFKRRHFSAEYAAQKFVRLIYNGQVLQRDDQTLQRCGLHNNCVVHCLIHAQQNTNRAPSQENNNTPPQDWNLGALLYAFLSVVLGAAWVCRFQYSHLFNITTTTALVGLTGMFAVAVIGLYMPDQERTM